MTFRFRAMGVAASALMAIGAAGPSLVLASPPDLIQQPVSDALLVTGNAATTSALCGGVCWDGGGGSFSVGHAPLCTGLWSDIDEAFAGCTVGGFSGTFVNDACGTGTADGSATGITEVGDTGTAGTANFHIDFFAGIGLLTDRGGSTEQGNTTGTDPVTFVGAVLLSPPGGTGLVPPNPNAGGFGECVPSFDFDTVAVALETSGS